MACLGSASFTDRRVVQRCPTVIKSRLARPCPARLPTYDYPDVAMRTLRAQLIAALTVVAVLLPGSAFARTQYFCRMMNRVVATCCCEGADRHEEETSIPEVRATDCCQKIAAGSQSVVAAVSNSDFSVPPAAVVDASMPTVLIAPANFQFVAPSIQARAPPAIGPPLFIAHCALLT